MTFKDEIAKLLAMELTNRDIAKRLGCNESYVSVVKHRIRHGGMRPTDRVNQQRRHDDYFSVPQLERQRLGREARRAGKHSNEAVLAAGRKLRWRREAEQRRLCQHANDEPPEG